jgi:hypothetical protein
VADHLLRALTPMDVARLGAGGPSAAFDALLGAPLAALEPVSAWKLPGSCLEAA